MYKTSLLNAIKTSVASFDDMDLLAKPVQCLRLPMLKTGTLLKVHRKRYWLGGACGEAGATHLTIARAELQKKQKTGRLQMSPMISCETSGRNGWSARPGKGSSLTSEVLHCPALCDSLPLERFNNEESRFILNNHDAVVECGR